MIESIEFYDEATEGPVATVSGNKARFLAKHSELIQTLMEIDPTAKHLQVPVSFPGDRLRIFAQLMKDMPLGFYHGARGPNWPGTNEVSWYPLGPEEERNIQANFNKVPKQHSIYKDEFFDRERYKIIIEVLQFLMLSPEGEEDFIRLNSFNNRRNQNSNRLEKKRRERATRRAKTGTAALNNRSYLNENNIEREVEAHKNYLYAIHKKNPTKLQSLLTRNNIATRKQNQNAINAEIANLERQIRNLGRKGYGTRYSEGNYYNSLDYYREKIEELEQDRHEIYNRYYNSSSYNNKPPLVYERELRGSRREGVEKHLPYQGPLVGNFFGNTNNI